MNSSFLTSQNIKRLLIGLILAGIMLIIVLWFNGRSYLEISVEGAKTGSDITYIVTDQASKKSLEISDSATSIKKLVTKSSYEVTIKQANSSYFAIVKTTGFLGTTSVSGKLSPEKNRKFVGNNPGTCMNYLNNVLLSLNCYGSFNDVRIHQPSTATTPTYTTKVTDSSYVGRIEGIIQTKEGTLVLRDSGPDIDEPGYQYIEYLDTNFTTNNEAVLTELNVGTPYTIKPYRDGFLVYDAKFEHFYYYATAKTKAVAIKIDPPNSKGLVPLSLDVQGAKLAVLYSHPSESVTKNKQGQSEIITYNDNQSEHYTFKKNYSVVRLCGVNEICLLGTQMDAYNISDTKPTPLFSVNDVLAIENNSTGLIAIRSKDVLKLNVDNAEGYIEYSFGDYSFYGIQTTSNGYVLSLGLPGKQRVALLIDETTNNTSSIDKKLQELRKLPEIDNISAYGQYIYISPNLGSVVLVPGSKGFDYDPVVKKRVNSTINRRVTELGIDPKLYTVINTNP